MGRHPLTFTAEKPMPAAQTAPSLANVVPFNKRGGRLLAKCEPITSTRPSKTVMPPASAATEGSTSRYGPKGVIIDFAHANPGGHAAKGHKYRSNENETGLTVTDYAAIAYVVITIAFYPVLAWLFSS
jgi:hypothetical protein